MLIPPDNFGMVEPGFYRCSKLEADHLPFLETLKLKSLVLLDVAKPPRTLKSFLHDNHVDLYNLGGLKISNHQNTGSSMQESGVDKKDGIGSGNNSAKTAANGVEVISLERVSDSKNDSWMIIEKNLVAAAFEILLDRSKHSVLIVDSSSALVGIWRKIQKWNFNSIVNEYRIYTGNASKVSYNVDVFLELISVELVPYELDHALRRKDEGTTATNANANTKTGADAESSRSASFSASPAVTSAMATPVSPASVAASLSRKLSASHFSNAQGSFYGYLSRSQRGSFDDSNAVCEDDDTCSLGDYEEDLDDELLSASPQIPANLLKLVEQRKNDGAASPGTSPDFRRPVLAGPRSNSLDLSSYTASRHRRRSSVESRYVRANNTRFRDPSFRDSSLRDPSFRDPSLTPGSSSPRRASLDANLRQFRMDQEKASNDEILRLKEKFNYLYYQPMGASANGFNVIKIRIPAEENLAPWFVKARDFWERKWRS